MEENKVKVLRGLEQFTNSGSEEEMKVIQNNLSYFINAYLKFREKHGPVMAMKHYLKKYSTASASIFEKNEITCSKGCSACCMQKVGLGEDELRLILDHISKHNVEIDMEYLKRQVDLEGDWNALPLHHRKCVFLNEDGGCKVYESRPMMCRRVLVTNDPEHCKTIAGEGIEGIVELEAEVIGSALINLGKQGTLHEMLLSELNV